MKRTNFVSLLLFLVLCIDLGWAQGPRLKKETFRATVVAEEVWNTCVWHPCWAGLIVRLDKGKGNYSYAHVSIEYFPDTRLPQRGFPLDLTAKAKKWKFDAIRRPDADGPLARHLKVIVRGTEEDISDDVAAPAWNLLPGAEDEKLPFGEVLPYYVVKPGKYKEIHSRKRTGLDYRN